MKFATLPSKTSKDEPNVIEITNRKLDETQKDGTKFEIPAERFTFAQFESLQEFIQDAGNEERALEILNDFKRDVAVTAGKNYIRTATKGTLDEVINSGLETAKNHSFAKSTEITAKEAKDALLSMRADIANLSPEEVKARLEKILGI